MVGSEDKKSLDNSQKTADKIIPTVIEDEMKQSYLDYAMSVIIGRALPDVRDGLKPVHRRILFGMNELANFHNKPFKKSARIVGEILGKFHPHGDVAVYDSIVRMAQEFSLRYPLIDGQGNFGCFTADTKIALADNRTVSFIDLIKEHQQGKKNFTFTVDNGTIKIAEIKNPRKTKENAEIMKVVLDNGEEIKCTLNHKFMLKSGDYKQAKDLKKNDSLMPCYFRSSTKADDPNTVGYSMVLQPKENSWEFVHLLADEWNIDRKIYLKSTGRIRHHLDFNKLNNHPDNIKRMHWKEHWKCHYNFTSEKHKTDPEYRRKLKECRERFWADEKNRKLASERLSTRNLNNWKKEGYREKMTAMLSKATKRYLKAHPESVEKIRKKSSETMKRLWQTPEYKKLFHDTIAARNKRVKTNLTGKKKFLKICKYLKEKDIELNKESFEKTRKEVFGTKSFTSWDLGLEKYFANDKNMLLCEMNGNHKVLKTVFLKEFVDVYDLTIDKTHNFALASGVVVHNSIDGDSAAAMRYSEVRLKKLAEDLLEDLDQDTVDFVPNFDNTLKEPTVLPCKVPNLLINGSAGIAVGMATNIPSHNIKEVCQGVISCIDKPEISVAELSTVIKGPDFPTSGIILGRAGIKDYLTTGRGKVIVRAKINIEDKRNKQQLIVTEIPYQINKSQLIEEIAEMVRNKVIVGISDLRDESNREGIRIVMELKQGSNSDVVQNQLFKHTRLQDTFGVILLSLVNNEPKVLNIKEMIVHFINHRKVVITRRTQFLLKNAQDKAHILEGLIIALKNIDDVIARIKKSKQVDEAKAALIKHYSLSEPQAKAILEMRLQRLAALEQEKIKDEHKATLGEIKELTSILKSEQRILDLIKKDMKFVLEKYGDERRTNIADDSIEIEHEDLIKEENVAVTCTHSGYIKKLSLEEYRQQHRGGKGVIATDMKETDFVEDIFVCSTHDYLLLFTNKGKVHWIKVYDIPTASKNAKGRAITNLLNISADEKIATMIPVKKFDDKHYLIMATRNGIIKKTNLIEYSNPRKGGIAAIDLEQNDSLINVQLSDGTREVILATRKGFAVRFKESDVRPVGRVSKGVIGCTLKDKDDVIGMEVCTEKDTLLTITENGYGKRSLVADYRLVRRGGVGVINIKVIERNGKVVAIKTVVDEDEMMFISQNGIIIRIPVRDISVYGRATQGVRVMKLDSSDKVVAAAKIARENAGI